jgi:hypothetical protein
MNSANSQSLAFSCLRGFARKMAAVIDECRYAQRRMTILRTAPDVHSPRPNAAPETYGEFLFRASGVLLHEPTARARERGSLLR